MVAEPDSPLIGGLARATPVVRSLGHELRGTSQDALWDRETELLRRRKIDDEVELCRLLDRQIRRANAFQDLVDVVRSPSMLGSKVRAVMQQTSGSRELDVGVDLGKAG